MTQTLLIEIGTEELPSGFVFSAAEQLRGLVATELSNARLSHGAIEVYATPRRLAVQVANVPSTQPALDETVLGPPESIAYGEAGLTQAGLGFAKKQGVDPSLLFKATTPKGVFVAFQRKEAGRSLEQLVQSLFTNVVSKIGFAKSMRWGELNVTFGRPIQWLTVLHGSSILPVTYAGLSSGRLTQGHRFLGRTDRPSAYAEVPSADDYLSVLKNARVMPSIAERRSELVRLLNEAANNANLEWIQDDFLIEENLSLVEWPHVLVGSFNPEYLDLPEQVILSVMRGHQRYFGARHKDGRLAPAYFLVANTALAPEAIIRGNDRVLRARLADAAFFIDEDKKVRLADRQQKLGGLIFQSKLGTVAKKAERLSHVLAKAGARRQDLGELAKADLVSLMVGEFPELEGAVGGYLARREGLGDDIAVAIEEHYRPRGPSDSLPSTKLGQQLSAFDRLDTLVGCFGVGLIPSGSADPYGLRRAALGVVRVSIEGQLSLKLREVIDAACAEYKAQGVVLVPDTESKVEDFFFGRLEGFFQERGFGADEIAACLGPFRKVALPLSDLATRLEAVKAFRSSEQFVGLSVGFKRAYNLTKNLESVAADLSLLSQPSEAELLSALSGSKASFEGLVERCDYGAALASLANLRTPIDSFFESTFVMDENLALRNARLNLLHQVVERVRTVVDLHLLDFAA